MSTVLWANILVNGKASTDESDKYALYKHAKKLTKLSNELKITNFQSLLDYTDAQYNVSGEDLPDGMESTTELMAVKGTWVSGIEAVEMLQSMIAHVSSNKTKFGLIKNDSAEVLEELKESLDFAIKAKNAHGMFNFAVVM